MRARRTVLGLAVLFTLVVAAWAKAADPCVTTSAPFSFKCVVGTCVDTVSVSRCLTDQPSSRTCNSCAVFQICCGQSVCSAQVGQSCGPNDPGGNIGDILSALHDRPEDARKLSSFYALDCRGEFVPLKEMFSEPSFPSNPPPGGVPTK